MSLITKNVIMDLEGKNEYLIRWSLWLPFGVSLKLHKIMRPDNDRGCAHSHPWRMLRMILWGGYTEKFGPENRTVERKPWRPWAPWRIYYCPKDFRHTITKLSKSHSWTIALCGARLQEWGFFTKIGWIQWRRFVDEAKENKALWCDDVPEQTLEEK